VHERPERAAVFANKQYGQATARRERSNSVAASEHSSERRQHRVGIRIDSPSRELPAFDSARPSGRKCSIGHNEHERALLVDRKVFNPVLVEHALQIDRSAEFPLRDGGSSGGTTYHSDIQL
jgi:hypothetical protein